jgi:hypothetical protein
MEYFSCVLSPVNEYATLLNNGKDLEYEKGFFLYAKDSVSHNDVPVPEWLR